MIRVKTPNKIYEANDITFLEETIIRKGKKTYRLVTESQDIAHCNLIKVNAAGFDCSSLYLGNLPYNVVRIINEEGYLAGTVDLSEIMLEAKKIERVAEIPEDKVYFADAMTLDNHFGNNLLYIGNSELFAFDSKEAGRKINPPFFSNNSSMLIDDTEDVFDDDDDWEETEEEI